MRGAPIENPMGAPIEEFQPIATRCNEHFQWFQPVPTITPCNLSNTFLPTGSNSYVTTRSNGSNKFQQSHHVTFPTRSNRFQFIRYNPFQLFQPVPTMTPCNISSTFQLVPTTDSNRFQLVPIVPTNTALTKVKHFRQVPTRPENWNLLKPVGTVVGNRWNLLERGAGVFVGKPFKCSDFDHVVVTLGRVASTTKGRSNRRRGRLGCHAGSGGDATKCDHRAVVTAPAEQSSAQPTSKHNQPVTNQ
eukprot:928920-Prorocentrum_minimum.AAC.2